MSSEQKKIEKKSLNYSEGSSPPQLQRKLRNSQMELNTHKRKPTPQYIDMSYIFYDP